MDLIYFAFFGVVAIFAIVIIVFIMKYIQPIRNSPAPYFMKAKKNKTTVFLMDDGSRYRITTGKTVDENSAIDDEGNAIIVAPDSIKYCMGIPIGVGENYRSIVANSVNAGFIEYCIENKWDAEKVKAYVEKIESIIEKKIVEVEKVKKEIEKKAEEKVEA